MVRCDKDKNNIQPFPQGIKKYCTLASCETLSSFYNSVENNVEINKILKNFSKDVYFNSFDQIVKNIKFTNLFLKFQKKININLILDLFVIFLVLFILNK